MHHKHNLTKILAIVLGVVFIINSAFAEPAVAIRLDEQDKKECLALREAIHTRILANNGKMSLQDRAIALEFKDRMCEKYQISSKEYYLDMEFGVFLLKEATRKGKLPKEMYEALKKPD